MAAAKAKANARPARQKQAKPGAPETAPSTDVAVSPAASAPRAPPQGSDGAGLAWVALALAALPALVELLYLATAPAHVEGASVLLVPLAALACPVGAIVLSAMLLSGRTSRNVDQGARTAAIVALVLGIAVVATWGIPLLVAMIVLASCTQPTPEPCTVTCSGSAQPEPQPCCPTCPHPGHGCGASGGCCGSSSSSGTGGGGCCGSGSTSSGGGGGGCCGSSSSPSVGTGGGPSVSSPGAGMDAVAGGLGVAYALRRRWTLGLPDLAHHPDTAAYREDVYRVGRHRLCVGCFTTLPVFVAASLGLACLSLEGRWWVWLAMGLVFASAQAVSALGLARRKWVKAAVKSSLGAGLALCVFAVRAAPWPPLAQGGALLGLAGLALASGLPRRRRMARAARTGMP